MNTSDQALRFQVKTQLRQRMNMLRTALPSSAQQTRSVAACTLLENLPVFQQARCIAAYKPIRGELNPDNIIHLAHNQHKTVALPYIPKLPESPSGGWGRVGAQHAAPLPSPTPDGEQDSAFVLQFRAYNFADPLAVGPWDIQQPTSDARVVPADHIDLVIVPALVVDERGYRVGYGQGYYDRTLPLLINATRVALVYDFQLVPEIPNTPGDEAVHVIVTDQQILTAAPAPH